jgi:hypothetical protein
MDFRRQSRQTSANSSEHVEKALDALVSDTPVSSSAFLDLTEQERIEVAALTRTAHLARIVMQSDSPDLNAEAKSLRRAEAALRNRRATGAFSINQQQDGRPTTSWIGNLIGRIRDRDGDLR